MTEYFDPIEKTQIDLKIAFAAHDRVPNYEGRLIDLINEQDVEQGIRNYFADCPEWDDELLPAAVKMYKESQELENAVQEIATNLLHSMGFPFRLR